MSNEGTKSSIFMDGNLNREIWHNHIIPNLKVPFYMNGYPGHYVYVFKEADDALSSFFDGIINTLMQQKERDLKDNEKFHIHFLLLNTEVEVKEGEEQQEGAAKPTTFTPEQKQIIDGWIKEYGDMFASFKWITSIEEITEAINNIK